MAMMVPLEVPVNITLLERDTAMAVYATESAGTSLRTCETNEQDIQRRQPCTIMIKILHQEDNNNEITFKKAFTFQLTHTVQSRPLKSKHIFPFAFWKLLACSCAHTQRLRQEAKQQRLPWTVLSKNYVITDHNLVHHNLFFFFFYIFLASFVWIFGNTKFTLQPQSKPVDSKQMTLDRTPMSFYLPPVMHLFVICYDLKPYTVV